MNVIENFCKYLSDYSNWDYGFNLSINDHCYFYLSDPMYRIHVDVDKSRGNKGYVTPQPEKHYEWIGVFEHELSAFKSGHNFNTGTLMNAQWLKISPMMMCQVTLLTKHTIFKLTT